MKMKRMVSLCLSLFLLTGAAFAAETPVSPAPSYEIAPVTDQTLTRVWGTAVEVGEDQVRLNNSNEEDPLSDIILNVNEETLVLDAVTGEELSFDQVEKDDVIYAYVGAAMTMSLPPQAYAQMILCNIPADFGVPSMEQIQSITACGEGYDVRVDEETVLHMEKDVELLASESVEEPALESLKPGDMLLTWRQAEEASCEAQGAVSKAMVFAGEYAGWLYAAPGELSINGNAVEFAAGEEPFVQGEKLMIPLRLVVEALGGETTWNRESRTIEVTDGEGNVLYTLDADESTYTRGESGDLDLMTPAVLRNGTTFLAAEDVLKLHDLKLEVR